MNNKGIPILGILLIFLSGFINSAYGIMEGVKHEFKSPTLGIRKENRMVFPLNLRKNEI